MPYQLPESLDVVASIPGVGAVFKSKFDLASLEEAVRAHAKENSGEISPLFVRDLAFVADGFGETVSRLVVEKVQERLDAPFTTTHGGKYGEIRSRVIRYRDDFALVEVEVGAKTYEASCNAKDRRHPSVYYVRRKGGVNRTAAGELRNVIEVAAMKAAERFAKKNPLSNAHRRLPAS